MDFNPWDPAFAWMMQQGASGPAASGPRSSAIQQLLASLTQGQGAPGAPPGGSVPAQPATNSAGAPGMIPVGTMTAPPVPPAPALDPGAVMSPEAVRSEAGIGLGNTIRNLLTGDAPQGYDSLLTPEQEQRAKPGLLQSIFGTVIGGPFASQMLYERNLGQAVDLGQLASKIQANRRQMAENARILAARQRMAQLFPQDPNAAPAQQKSQLIGMYNYAVANGDVDMAAKIGARMNDMFKENANQTAPHVLAPGAALVGPAGNLLYTNPEATKHQGAATTYQSPDGRQFRAFFPDQTPPPGWKPWARPAGTGSGMALGLGSGGIGTIARQAGAIVGMGNANDVMVPFEQRVLAGQANYTGLDYYKGMWSKMYDASGHMDPVVHAGVYAKLNQENPELANYIAAAEQWALEDSQLSGRPSDFRTKLDAYISAIGPNAQKSTILQRQKFRATRLDELNKFRPAMEAAGARMAAAAGAPVGGAGAAAPSSPPPVMSERQRLYDEAAAFLQKQGSAAAQILQKLGPRPGQ